MGKKQSRISNVRTANKCHDFTVVLRFEKCKGNGKQGQGSCAAGRAGARARGRARRGNLTAAFRRFASSMNHYSFSAGDFLTQWILCKAAFVSCETPNTFFLRVFKQAKAVIKCELQNRLEI